MTLLLEEKPPLLVAQDRPSFWRRLFGVTRRLHARSDWPEFAGDDWAERIMEAQLTDDFHQKQGRSTGRWVLEKDGRTLSVYLKRHYQLPRRHGLMAALWPGGSWSPGMQEYRNLEWAQAQGLPVPRVVAAGEYLAPAGRLQSFLAIEELTDMLALHQAIPLAARQLEPRAFRAWKAGLARELARLARCLHDRRRFHKDLYLCHFYLARADTAALVRRWPGRVSMIDFHRLGHHPFTWPWWQMKDLGQLLYSTFGVEGVDARDRLRFWRHYLAPARRRGRRFLTWCVRLRGDNYRQHNEKDRAT